jgi:hypothetical protein
MVAILEQDSFTPGTGTWTLPSGWTSLYNDSMTVDGAEVCVAYKVAGGSEPGSYTFSCNTTTVGAGGTVGIISAYSGVDNSTPINASAPNKIDTAVASPYTVTGASITTTVDNCWLIWMGIADRTNVTNCTFAVPSGYSSRATVQGASGNEYNGAQIADKSQGSHGSTGTQSANWTQISSSAGTWAVHVALAPAGGTSPLSVSAWQGIQDDKRELEPIMQPY